MKTILLDKGWDLVLDASGNIAVASEPYSLSQDACSAVKLFSGEQFYDTDIGVPYWPQILGYLPPISLLRAAMIKAALTTPGVAKANVFFYSFLGRKLSGQLQVTPENGKTVAVEF